MGLRVDERSVVPADRNRMKAPMNKKTVEAEPIIAYFTPPSADASSFARDTMA